MKKKRKNQNTNIENKDNTITHKVKKGENLESIAKNNNTTVDELKRINNLTDTKIRQGQEIKLSQSLERSKHKS